MSDSRSKGGQLRVEAHSRLTCLLFARVCTHTNAIRSTYTTLVCMRLRAWHETCK